MVAMLPFVSTGLTIACWTLLTSASVLQPPVLPLIVRNPYLSTWLSDARDVPWSRIMFYTGQEIGFGILARVPHVNTVYPLLGRLQDSLDADDDRFNISYPSYLGSDYDPSTTNLTYHIPSPKPGGSAARLTLSFLSPITPESTFRQSIPGAYVSISVLADFDISLYIDINGQWVSGDRDAEIEWAFDEATEATDGEPELKTWSIKRKHELLFTENRDRAEWGSLLFTGPYDANHECGPSDLLRNRFALNGDLANGLDRHHRRIMDREPVFAFVKHFKGHEPFLAAKSSLREVSVLFTLMHVRDPVAQFASARGLTHMKPLWKSWISDNEQLTRFHYNDYETAFRLAKTFSDRLAVDAYKSGSDDYVDIVALSARQTMGATEFVGTAEQPLLLLKEISSDGNCQTIDVIFPAFPFFLYTNPRWLAYLLEPLLEHMLSGQYPNKYAMHDLGARYPNATGHPTGNDEYMPVEECGNILIMMLAVVNSLQHSSGQSLAGARSMVGSEGLLVLTAVETRDGVQGIDPDWKFDNGAERAREWLQRSYVLAKQWTGYLVEFALEPHNQLSTDDFAGRLALHTNLALKGIIGIRAMSELATIMGQEADAGDFRNIAEQYVKRWEELGISRDKTHAKLAYDWYGSWTTLYSLYADALLCFHTSPEASSPAEKDQAPLDGLDSINFIPTHIYQMQSDWYSVVMQKYGLPLDSRHLYSKSDWAIEAAAVASRRTRKEILGAMARWVNETVTDKPLTDLFLTEGDGDYPGPYFYARPVVGGHFALLALERACGGHAMDGLGGLR